MSLYGSEKLAKVTWDFMVKNVYRNRTPIPDLGDEAYLVKQRRGYDRVVVRVGNVHVLHINGQVVGGGKDGPIRINKLPPRLDALREIVARVRAREVPPIPPGVLTAMPKKAPGGAAKP